MREEPIRILLIEDNPRDAGLVKEMLAETNTVRFELTHSDRLLKALEILGKDRVDIILLDLSLPDGHGLDTVIQTNTAKPEIPIVIMSGMGDEDLAIKALHEGAQDYLVKGQVDSNLLTRSIRYAIERKQSEEALRRAYDELDMRVQERTLELVLTNEALIVEIAERKKAEEALQKSEASLAEAQRIAGLGNWDLDIQTNELQWSDEIYRIFGLSPKEFGATFDEFMNYVHADDREFVKKSVGEALYGRPYDIEHRIILPDGTIRIVHEQGEVTFGESGEPLRMLGTVQDITESKEKEMRLIMSERLAALGQMASGIAHEINNPLASIAACAEGLLNRMRKGQSDPDLSENYLNIINEEVIRCKGITTSMLSFVRKTDYEKKDVDIHDVLDKTLELIGFQGRLKEVELIKHYGGILMVRGNEGELKQVFLAIVVNAIDAMEDRGSLTIRTMIIPSRSNFQLSGGLAEENESSEVTAVKDGRDFAAVKISDTGYGINPELKDKIFEPFFTTKAEKGGTGLGLSISHKIIKDHNGNITVDSEIGKGTTFTIILPK